MHLYKAPGKRPVLVNGCKVLNEAGGREDDEIYDVQFYTRVIQKGCT